MHVAKTGWLYRYEAYLVSMAILSFFLVIPENIVLRLKNLSKLPLYQSAFITFFVIMILIALLPYGYRIYKSHYVAIKGSATIYHEQYQTGRFIKKYYNGHTVAINDIGAPSFLADIKIVDFYGLATKEVTKATKEGYFTTDFIEKISLEKGASIAMVWEPIVDNPAPESWFKCGEVVFDEGIKLDNHTISIFAIDPDETELLRINIEDFNAFLPKGVRYQVIN